MRVITLLTLITALGIGLVLGDFASVKAQDEFTLEEITVTAQKREENKQKVAIPMTVIGGEELKEFGVSDLYTMLQSDLPSVVVGKGDQGLYVSMHGISASGGLGEQPAVSVNVDGVSSNRADNALGLYDLERVEILYGPQSTYYATNSPGGVINVETANPKIDTFEGSTSLEYGNFNLRTVTGMVNVPLGSTMAFRGAFQTKKRDGYLSNGAEDTNSMSTRLKLLYEPNDWLSATISTQVATDDGKIFTSGVQPFGDEAEVDDPWAAEELGATVGTGRAEREKIYGTIDVDLGFATFSATPSVFDSYSKRRTSYEERGEYYETMRVEDNYEKSVEFRLASSPDFTLFEWIIGYFYLDGRMGYNRWSQEYEETGQGTYTIHFNDEELTSIFANIKYPFTDRFRVEMGIRKSDDSWAQKGWTYGPNPDDPTEFVVFDRQGNIDPDPQPTYAESPSKPDYKLGVEYDVSDNSMVYASFASSYRMRNPMGTINEYEEYTNYTLGTKNQFLENKIQLNASAYYYKYKNRRANQLSRMDVWLYDLDDDLYPDQDEQFPDMGTAALGDGHSYGADVMLSALLSQKDQLDLTLAYQDSEWTDLYFDYTYDEYIELVNGELVTVYDPYLDFSGEPIDLTTPWSLSLKYRHNFVMPNSAVISLVIDSIYKQEYTLWPDPGYYPYNFQESFHKHNISGVYASPDGKWTLSAYVRNIFDYAEKIQFRKPGGLNPFLSIGDPRTYGAVLTVKF